MVVRGVRRERAVRGTGGNFPLLFTIVLDGPFRLPYLSCGEPPDNLILVVEMIDRPTYVFDTISVGFEDSLDNLLRRTPPQPSLPGPLTMHCR